MGIRITLSANAGISLIWKNTKIWIDAVHNQKTESFSVVSPALFCKMKEHPDFSNPDFIFFTHLHPDHYDFSFAEEAKTLFPNARFILPEPVFPDQLLLTGSKMQFSYNGIRFEFLRLTHEGEQFREVPHYALILKSQRHSVLIAGDTELACPALKEALLDTKIDIALLDFPWITLNRGLSFVKNVICPKQLLVYHIPFEEDDTAQFREAVNQSTLSLSKQIPCHILSNPLQSIDLSF